VSNEKLCGYGCGQEAKHQFKNGKLCCSEHWKQCPESRRKSGRSGELNPMFGKDPWNKNLTIGTSNILKETSKKISNSLKGKIPWNVGVRPYNYGKTLIEMYGKEKAREIKEKRSKSVSNSIISDKSAHPKKYKYLQGYHCSEKAVDSKIYYASSYELALFRSLDRSLSAVKYLRPKFSIPYFYNGIIRNYHPDVIVLDFFLSGPQLIEVKPKYETDHEINLSKWEAAEKFCLKNELLFAVLTEESLKEEIKLIYKEFNLTL
jgi:hypothetical protein